MTVDVCPIRECLLKHMEGQWMSVLLYLGLFTETDGMTIYVSVSHQGLFTETDGMTMDVCPIRDCLLKQME